MKKITYYCDKCGKQLSGSRNISLQIHIINYNPKTKKPKTKAVRRVKVGHLCEKCTEYLVKEVIRFTSKFVKM